MHHEGKNSVGLGHGVGHCFNWGISPSRPFDLDAAIHNPLPNSLEGSKWRDGAWCKVPVGSGPTTAEEWSTEHGVQVLAVIMCIAPF